MRHFQHLSQLECDQIIFGLNSPPFKKLGNTLDTFCLMNPNLKKCFFFFKLVKLQGRRSCDNLKLIVGAFSIKSFKPVNLKTSSSASLKFCQQNCQPLRWLTSKPAQAQHQCQSEPPGKDNRGHWTSLKIQHFGFVNKLLLNSLFFCNFDLVTSPIC